MSLKKQAASGVFWVAIAQYGQQLVRVVVFIALARLLSPEDFGLVAMVMIFFEISQVLVNSGLGQALIRLQVITDEDRSTVFWFNLAISVLLFGVLFMSAPGIASFFDVPKLTNLVRFMGLAILFFGIAIVQRSELTQRLDFKSQALIQLPTAIVAGGISITMAYTDYGVWALATQFVMSALLSSALYWILKPSKISFKWYPNSFKNLFGFGYKLMLSGMLETIFQNMYKLVIGKYFAASILGFYTQAKNIQAMAGQHLIGIIQKVAYPLLSKTNDDPKRMRTGYRQVILTSSFVIYPAMFSIIIFADQII
jgi:teichuronic acid exporter